MVEMYQKVLIYALKLLWTSFLYEIKICISQ